MAQNAAHRTMSFGSWRERRREKRKAWRRDRAHVCAKITARGAWGEETLGMGSGRWEALRQGPARWDRAGPRHWAAAEPRPLSTQRAAAARRLRRARGRGRP